MAASMVVGVVNVEQFDIRGVTETHYICRTPEGESVDLRIQSPITVGYCVMQWMTKYRHHKFRPTDTSQMPVSTGCADYKLVVDTLGEFPIELTHRYDYYHSGETFAIAETGRKAPTCLHIRITETSNRKLGNLLKTIRSALGKLGRGIRLVKNAYRTEEVSRTVASYSMKLYGVYRMRAMKRPSSRVSRMDHEYVVTPHSFEEIVDPPRELREKLHPVILYMDAEQIASLIGNFSSLNRKEDAVIMMSVVIGHQGYPEDGTMHMIAMDSEIGDTLTTDDGVATVHSVDYSDEAGFWRKLLELIHQVQPDYIMAWNGYTYDFPLMMTRLYAFSMLKPIPNAAEIVTMPPPGTSFVSRFIDSVACMRNYQRTASAFFGKEPVYIPMYPGVGIIDAMCAYRAFLAPSDGLSLNACAERHGLAGKKSDVSYTDITYAYRSVRFYHECPPDAPLDDIPLSSLDDARRTAILRGVYESIPNTSDTSRKVWTELLQTKTYQDVVRLMDILPFTDARPAMDRVYRYAMYDSVVMRNIMRAINFWPTVQQFGLMQFLTPVVATSSGPSAKVWHSMWKLAVTRKLQMSTNPHEKLDKYGGGQVLYPTFQSRTPDGRFLVIVIYDFNSMYPAEIQNDNLSADTFVPDWLSSHNVLESQEYVSHRPITHSLRFDAKLMPYVCAIDTTVIDHINVCSAEGVVHVMMSPHERAACDIVNHRMASTTKAIAKMWKMSHFQRLRRRVKRATAGGVGVAVDEIPVSYSDGSAGLIGVVALLATVYDAQGLPVYKPTRIWAWKSPLTKTTIRILDVVGGKKSYPSFVVSSAQLGLLPEMIRDYLDARARWKREMKRIVAEVAAIASDEINTKLIETWPKALRDKYVDANIRQMCLKIGANSAYGASGCPGALYHTYVPTTITSACRLLLGHLIELVRQDGDSEVYGDTDSVMVQYDPQVIAKRIHGESATGDATVAEIVEYCKKAAKSLNVRLQEGYPDHGVSCDGIAGRYFQLYKKKYAYVPLVLCDKFDECNPKSLAPDYEGIHDIVTFKGLSCVKSDQTLWAKRALEHIVGAALAGATVGELEVIYEFHVSSIIDEPVERLLKISKVNLAKAGPGNSAARRAVAGGHPIRTNDKVAWAQLRDGSYSTMYTASRTEISDGWVAAMIDKEYQRVLHVVRLLVLF